MYWPSLLLIQIESKPEPPETYHNFSMDFGGMPGTLLPETNSYYVGKSQGLNFKDLYAARETICMTNSMVSAKCKDKLLLVSFVRENS